MRIVHFCFGICALLPIVFEYRILGVFPVPSKSHYYVGEALMQGLAERGHEVTLISPFQSSNPINNNNEQAKLTRYIQTHQIKSPRMTHSMSIR